MFNDQLNYVKRELAKGRTKEQVKLALLQAGYDKSTADDLLRSASGPKDDHVRNAAIVGVVALLLLIAVIVYLKPVTHIISPTQQTIIQKLPPPQAAKLMALGQVAYDSQDFSKAKEFFLNATGLSPDDADALCHLGLTYSKLKENVYAQAALEKSVDLDPYDSTCYAGLAHVYYVRGEYDTAVQAANKSIILSPNANAFETLGWSYLKLKQYDMSIASFNQSQQISHSTAKNYDGLAFNYYYLHNLDLSKEYFILAIGINAHDALACYGIGLINLKDKDYDAALSNFNDAIRFDNSTAKYYYYLAYTQNLAGDSKAAKISLDRYFAYNSQDVDNQANTLEQVLSNQA